MDVHVVFHETTSQQDENLNEYTPYLERSSVHLYAHELCVCVCMCHFCVDLNFLVSCEFFPFLSCEDN